MTEREAAIARIDAELWQLEKLGEDVHYKRMNQLRWLRKALLPRKAKRYIGVALFMLIGGSLYFLLLVHETERNRINAIGPRTYDRNGVAYDTYKR